ncbi:hypothetical protein [Nesterenkonia alba]|uniref:hypothetical protein n=1 Tax=Nesterenkonia alba TaxID=515814 RepID=UPI0012EBDE77|nr:hypothetical protein [Nesterenkonia alba]
MAAAPVPPGAITTSLHFALGYGKNTRQLKNAPAEGSVEIDDDDDATVLTSMLTAQGVPSLVPEVLQTIAAARQALQRDPSLTISAQGYDKVRKQFLTEHAISGGTGRHVWPVGSTTILKRAGGSWSQALQEAGLGTSSAKPAGNFGAARFTEEDFITALREFARHAEETGGSTSYQNYLTWRKHQQQSGRSDLPSGAAVRNTFGSWSAALQNL